MSKIKKNHKQKTKNKPPYRLRNWSQYNQALVQRGSLTIWFSEDVLNQWYYQGPKQRGASFTYTDLVIETALTLKAVFHLGFRQSQGLLGSILLLLGVDLKVPNYSTLCRRQKTLSVDLGVGRAEQARHIVIDSTGLKVYGEGEWKVRQYGYAKRRTWRKLHLGLDESTGEVVACVLTDNATDDAQVVPALLDQVEGEIAAVGADGAYDKRKVYRELTGRQMVPIIPPQRNARIWQHGNCKAPPHPRDEALRYIRRHGRKKWKRDSGYHRRSKAENAMYRYKTIFGSSLWARTLENQQVEAQIKSRVLNRMTHLGMPESYAAA